MGNPTTGEQGTAAGSPTTPRAALEALRYQADRICVTFRSITPPTCETHWSEWPMGADMCEWRQTARAALAEAPDEAERCGCPTPDDREGYMPPCRYGCKDPLSCQFPHPGCDHCRRVRSGLYAYRSAPAPAPTAEACRHRRISYMEVVCVDCWSALDKNTLRDDVPRALAAARQPSHGDAEALRDALLAGHAAMGYGHGPVYAKRLDAIIAAARQPLTVERVARALHAIGLDHFWVVIRDNVKEPTEVQRKLAAAIIAALEADRG